MNQFECNLWNFPHWKRGYLKVNVQRCAPYSLCFHEILWTSEYNESSNIDKVQRGSDVE